MRKMMMAATAGLRVLFWRIRPEPSGATANEARQVAGP
jgi:hypothetical protein